MTAARTRLSPAAPQAAPGLRERKKIKTRIAIRRATLALIEEQGYDATTVEQIAAAAEVSPSTVIRYFPAKEDIVLTTAHEPLVEAALRARPADEPVVDSLRHIVKDLLLTALAESTAADRAELLLRCRLLHDVPAVRARLTESLTATGRLLAEVIADRTGQDAADLKVRVLATSVVGALLEAVLYWTEHGQGDDLPALVDEALDAVGHRP